MTVSQLIAHLAAYNPNQTVEVRWMETGAEFDRDAATIQIVVRPNIHRDNVQILAVQPTRRRVHP